ncbi:MAG TPA: hypothetical protein VGD83_11710 [Streptosporangiaceae bacterium]
MSSRNRVVADDQTLDLAVLVLGDEEQVNQRTDVGGVFRPGGSAASSRRRPGRAHDEWHAGERRYLSEEFMARLPGHPQARRI